MENTVDNPQAEYTFPILRSFVAVVGGYLVAFMLVAFTFNALAALTPEVFGMKAPANPPLGWFILTYVLSFLYAAIAGYVTATIARRNEMMHAAALAIFMLILGIAASVSMAAPERILQELMFSVVGMAGVLFGAKIRARAVISRGRES
ncbi:MAG: hypothetical protein ABL958_14070 [Bdellovibrionia bacterium]